FACHPWIRREGTSMTTVEKGNTNSAPRPRNSAVSAPQGDLKQSAIDPAELGEIYTRQRAAFDRNPAPTLAERRATLAKLARLIEQNRVIFVEAANADFGNRDAAETEMSEIVGTISIIRYMRRRLRSWMAPRRRSVS